MLLLLLLLLLGRRLRGVHRGLLLLLLLLLLLQEMRCSCFGCPRGSRIHFPESLNVIFTYQSLIHFALFAIAKLKVRFINIDFKFVEFDNIASMRNAFHARVR
jgi:hypothetical protein